MKRVLYISYDGMTDALGRSQVLPYLNGLSQSGYHITLISAEKADAFAKGKVETEQVIKEMGINWQPVEYTKEPPVLSTLWDILKMRKRAFQLHHQEAFHLVHCRSYISAFIGLAMKRRFGCRFVFDMRGFYADERVDGNIWPQSNVVFKMVYHFFKRKEKVFLNESDAIVSLTIAAKNEILSWSLPGVTEQKIKVIPCCADLSLFDYHLKDETLTSEWKRNLQIPDESFVLSYLGSVGTWYMLPEMMDFFKLFLQDKPHSIFLFITRDSTKEIYSEAQKRNIPWKTLRVQPATRAEVPQLAMLSNASVFFIKPVWSKKASSPTKLAELMGMGIPVFTNSGVGDVDKIIQQNPLGILIEGWTIAHYSLAISQFNQLSVIDKEASRQLACENFSLEKGISTFEQIYQQL